MDWHNPDRWRSLFLLIPLLLRVTSGDTAEDATPTFTSFPSSEILAWEGSTLTLKCPLSTDSSFDIEWHKDGKDIGRKALVLSIPRLSRIDSGLYRCLASTANVRSFSSTVNVTVLCKFRELHKIHGITTSTRLSDLDRFESRPPSFFNLKANPSGHFVLRPPPLEQSGRLDLSWKWFFNSQEVIFRFLAHIPRSALRSLQTTRTLSQ